MPHNCCPTIDHVVHKINPESGNFVNLIQVFLMIDLNLKIANQLILHTFIIMQVRNIDTMIIY